MSSHRTDKQCGFHSLDLDFGTLKRVFVECARLHDNYHWFLELIR